MDQIQNEGYTASFACQVDGEPLPTIIWYFNGAPFDESDTSKYMIIDRRLDTVVMNTLIIITVQSSDVGTYTCNATNVVSNDTSSEVLTVNGELQFVLYEYAKQKHLGCKKGEANQKQQLSDYGCIRT